MPRHNNHNRDQNNVTTATKHAKQRHKNNQTNQCDKLRQTAEEIGNKANLTTDKIQQLERKRVMLAISRTEVKEAESKT